MRTLLNILWNVPGLGFVAAFFWALSGVLMAITIIGLPWERRASHSPATRWRRSVASWPRVPTRQGATPSAPADWDSWQTCFGSCSPDGGW